MFQTLFIEDSAQICWACWSYLDLLWTAALLKQMTAAGLLRKQGDLGVVSWLKGGKRPSPPANSLYHCQQPLSAASFSSLDPALSFFCLLDTRVFSPLLLSVLRLGLYLSQESQNSSFSEQHLLHATCRKSPCPDFVEDPPVHVLRIPERTF